MHVVMVADLAPEAASANGVQRATLALVRALSQSGLDVTVVTPTSGETDDGVWGFPVERVPMGGALQLLRGFRPWQSALASALDRLKPDIVHAQGLLHNGAAAVRYTAAPTIVTAHGDPLADARAHYSSPVFHALRGRLRSTVLEIVERADHIIDVTPDWRVNLPVEPASWSYIPNALEPQFFAEVPAPRSARVLYFGGGRSIKGLDILLDSWPLVRRALPAAELHAFGLGSNDEALIRRCSETDGCLPAGSTTDRDVARLMRAGGVLAVPSRYEVSPVVIAEAWASGLPVVACDVGGIRALDHGALSVCPPEDPAALADRLIASMSESRDLDARVARGMVLARSQRPESVAAAHLELYARINGSLAMST